MIPCDYAFDLFSKDLEEDFDKVMDLMWTTLVDYDVGLEMNDNKLKGDARKKVKSELLPLVQQMKSRVAARLRCHGEFG